jgi:sugar lactone lactonase YvrE
MRGIGKWAGMGLLGIGLVIGLSCEAPEQPVYGPDNPDPNPTGLAPAVMDSISPAEGYLKDLVTIYGSGFNTTPEFNMVAFGKNTAEVVAATETQLQVRAPNLADKTVNVKVAIKGSEFWSNEGEFTFKPTLTVIDEEIVWPNGVDVDADGNVYIGSAVDGIIYKITPDGTKSEFAAVAVNGSIRFGPQGYLYVCVQGEGKIVRISPDGSTIEDAAVVEEGAPVYFDWDAQKNMYIVDNNGRIVRMDTQGGFTDVATVGSPKSCRVFGSYLYVTDIWNSTILRYTITAAGLENEEILLEPDSPASIELDSEGTLYYTQAWETSLYTLKADGTEEIIYEGELMTPMRYLTFHGKTMYIVFPGWGDVGMVMSAYIGVEQAPNYGLD